MTKTQAKLKAAEALAFSADVILEFERPKKPKTNAYDMLHHALKAWREAGK